MGGWGGSYITEGCGLEHGLFEETCSEQRRGSTVREVERGAIQVTHECSGQTSARILASLPGHAEQNLPAEACLLVPAVNSNAASAK